MCSLGLSVDRKGARFAYAPRFAVTSCGLGGTKAIVNASQHEGTLRMKHDCVSTVA